MTIPGCQQKSSCDRLKDASKHFTKAFWLAWLIKGAAPVLLKKARQQKGSIMMMSSLLDHQVVRSSAVLAAFFAFFRELERRLPKELDEMRAGVAGMLASLVFSLEKSKWRAPWAQYLGLRATLAILKGRLSTSSYNMLTCCLFIVSTAQLMYGVVVRPEAGDGLQSWLTMIGVLPDEAKLDSARLSIKEGNGNTCPHLHESMGCVERVVSVYAQVFKVTLPINLVITFVSSLKGKKSFGIRLEDALLSSGFTASAVTMYQILLCLHGRLLVKCKGTPKHRLVYWFFGLISGFTIFLERPERRPEVALFSLNRATTLFINLTNERHAIAYKNADMILLSISLGIIMQLHRTQPHLLSFLANTTIRLFT